MIRKVSIKNIFFIKHKEKHHHIKLKNVETYNKNSENRIKLLFD